MDSLSIFRRKMGYIDPKSFVFTDAATGMETNDPLGLSERDFIIAVMGPTGAGKSTFIKNATGCGLTIGDDLESCTSEIHTIRVRSGDSKIYIVDTPGFNDTNKSDLEIFKLMSEWLRQRFTNQVYLAGLIYLCRISDNRMGGTTMKNLKIFEDLCGKDCFHKIRLATTMWDDMETESLGASREKELKRDYFSIMMARGADYKRLGHSQTSARDLLDSVIDRARELRPLSLQKELVAYQKDLPHTNAGRKMYSKLNEVLQSRQDVLAQLNRDLRAEKSPRVRTILTKERQELTQELTVLIADMHYMQLSLPPRITQLVTGSTLVSPRSETAMENLQSKDTSARQAIVFIRRGKASF
ncbi:P-loop containing nucleoside triphosphate hydrolase protein [Panaeolus papilionaceus]|nr:P-loop containing nucleoside triphosphate hydrolase protein [Panaeolus papilionaceus]